MHDRDLDNPTFTRGDRVERIASTHQPAYTGTVAEQPASDAVMVWVERDQGGKVLAPVEKLRPIRNTTSNPSDTVTTGTASDPSVPRFAVRHDWGTVYELRDQRRALDLDRLGTPGWEGGFRCLTVSHPPVWSRHGLFPDRDYTFYGSQAAPTAVESARSEGYWAGQADAQREGARRKTQAYIDGKRDGREAERARLKRTLGL